MKVITTTTRTGKTVELEISHRFVSVYGTRGRWSERGLEIGFLGKEAAKALNVSQLKGKAVCFQFVNDSEIRDIHKNEIEIEAKRVSELPRKFRIAQRVEMVCDMTQVTGFFVVEYVVDFGRERCIESHCFDVVVEDLKEGEISETEAKNIIASGGKIEKADNEVAEIRKQIKAKKDKAFNLTHTAHTFDNSFGENPCESEMITTYSEKEYSTEELKAIEKEILNLRRKAVMKLAWLKARKAALKFGGKANMYISECIKQAWIEIN